MRKAQLYEDDPALNQREKIVIPMTTKFFYQHHSQLRRIFHDGLSFLFLNMRHICLENGQQVHTQIKFPANMLICMNSRVHSTGLELLLQYHNDIMMCSRNCAKGAATRDVCSKALLS